MSTSLLYVGTDNEGACIPTEDFYQDGPTEESFWIHLSIEDPVQGKWLREKSGIDPLFVESMLSKKVRPRLVPQEDSLLLILRVPDTLDVEEHEELRSLRIYVDDKKIVSTSLCHLPVLDEILEKWRKKATPESTITDLLLDLVAQSVRGLEVILEDLEEQTDLLEEQVLDSGEDPPDHEITRLVLDGLHVRRCLAPQKEVLLGLSQCDISWLGVAERQRIREVHERVSRQLEEIEVNRDRARIIREQFNSHVADQVNQRLYVFSLVALVFIPLGFLTGLLGVNLGGIPGADHPFGFIAFCSVLAALTLGMFFLVRHYKWI